MEQSIHILNRYRKRKTMVKYTTALLLAFGVFAQAPTYRMTGVSPAFNQSLTTFGPYDCGGKMSAICISTFKGVVTTYGLATNNNIVEIGVPGPRV
jgi:hypothetical protein